MKTKIIKETVVTYWVLWQGMHDTYTARFPGESTVQRVAKKAKRQVVSFSFKIIEIRTIYEKGFPHTHTKILKETKEFYLGGTFRRGKYGRMIVTRHGSTRPASRGDSILPGF